MYVYERPDCSSLCFSRLLDEIAETEILRGAKILGLRTSRERRKEVRGAWYHGRFSVITAYWFITDVAFQVQVHGYGPIRNGPTEEV